MDYQEYDNVDANNNVDPQQQQQQQYRQQYGIASSGYG